MRNLKALLGAILLIVLGCPAGHAAGIFGSKPLVQAVRSEPTTFAPRDADPVEGELFTLTVPENRRDDQSRTIAVRFIRLPAVEPQGLPPIVYLAGGPGGSATGAARGERWAMFDRLRQNADVILFDQRGTGLSDQPPDCTSQHGWTPDVVPTRAAMIEVQERAFAECRAFWSAAGVDLRGYNTAESADDLAAVAEVLGGRVSLLSISYGSHLALATIKRHPKRVVRAVLVGTEGLDQTVKMPSGTDAYFRRLQAAVNSQEAAAALYPDIARLLRRVADRLDAEPVTVGEGENARQLTGYCVKLVAGYSIADPEGAARLLAALRAADEQQDYSHFARYAPFLLPAGTRLRAMPTGMDLASGVSERRLARIQSQAERSLLADALNFPMPHLASAAGDLALPRSFRRRPRGGTPVLVITGTLDGRTYPEEAMKATRGLRRNRTVLRVENGGHNIFFHAPEIVPAIATYLSGDEVASATFTAELPDMTGSEG